MKHKVTLRNRSNVTFEGDEEEPIIDTLEKNGLVLPVGCRYGGCITCAAKLVSGKVHQPNAAALKKRQENEGYVLLCVARPREDCVLEVGVESHDNLYQNPFAQSTASDALVKASQR